QGVTRRDMVVLNDRDRAAPARRARRPTSAGRKRRLIKRVIERDDDTVHVREGTLFVNGVRSPWGIALSPRDAHFGPCEVPGDHVFVLGEELTVSRDSRVFGAVPSSLVVGRALVVYWPVSWMRSIRPSLF